MSTIYDGKLTAWAGLEAEKILNPILPSIGKLYEGKNEFEIKTKDPRYSPARNAIVALAREYARKERSGEYENPVEVEGEVYHGCDDD